MKPTPEQERAAREFADCYYYSAKNPLSAPFAKGREHKHKIPCECTPLAAWAASREAAAFQRGVRAGLERAKGVVRLNQYLSTAIAAIDPASIQDKEA